MKSKRRSRFLKATSEPNNKPRKRGGQKKENSQCVITSRTVIMNAGDSTNRRIAVSPDGKQLAVPLTSNVFKIYSLGGGEREIYPFTTVRGAAEMNGFVGLGFAHGAVRQGEQGVADIMFE